MRLLRTAVAVLFIIVVGFSIYTYFASRTDSTPPLIRCDTEEIVISVKDTEADILSHVTAIDERDGDMSDRVLIENISAFIEPGVCDVTFAVSDLENNVSKIGVRLRYSDYTLPDFSLNAPLIVYSGTKTVVLSAFMKAYDSIEGDISNRIVVLQSDVDTAVRGVYPTTFRVTTAKGCTEDIELNVYVEDVKPRENISLSNYLVYTDIGQKIDFKGLITEYPSEYLAEDFSELMEYRLVIDSRSVDYETPGIYDVVYRIIGTEKNPRIAESAESVLIAQTIMYVVVREAG